MSASLEPRWKRRVVAGLLAATMIGTTATAASARPTKPHYTDAEIVAGVIFGQGPVGKKIGIEQAEETPEVTAAREDLYQSILKNDKAAVRAFAKEVSSGDPYVARDAMADGSAMLERAIERETGHKAMPSVAPTCGVICVCVAVVELAAVGGIAVVAVAETAIGGHFVLWSKSKFWNNAAPPEDISLDTFSAEVTHALAA